MIGLKAIYFIEEAHLISEDTCRLTVKGMKSIYQTNESQKKKAESLFVCSSSLQAKI